MATKQWPVSYPCGVSRQIAGDHANFPLFPGVVISPDINVSGRERYCHQPEYPVGLRAQSTGNAPWLIALAIPVYFSAALSLSYWILDVNKPKKSLKIAFTITTLCYVLFAWITQLPGYFVQPYIPLIALLIITLINIKCVSAPLKILSPDPGTLRQQLTRAMANCLWLAGVILCLWIIYGLGLLWSRGISVSDALIPHTSGAVKSRLGSEWRKKITQ
jgi:hypothetical protein